MPRFAAEAPWSRRLAVRLLREVPAARETDRFGTAPCVADAEGEAPIVFVCADPEALVPRAAQDRLVAALAAAGPSIAAILPVSNESELEALRRPPGFGYASLSELESYAAEAASGPRAVSVLEGGAAPIAFPVYAVRRAALANAPADLSLAALPEALAAAGRGIAVDPGAYVHRYGAMDASPRSDLVAKLPAGTRRVLDVGCSQGATASALRAAGVEEIVGVEPDAADAGIAGTRYDRVIGGRLEDVREPWDAAFDAILFGDVLEHLEDPSDALVRVRPWLAPGGRVVASVPNVGNWAVVGGLLEERFDYVPYSTLSGTHLRFFTRRSLADLFEACGYAVESIEGVAGDPPPAGRALLAKLASLPGASADLGFLEWVVVARSADGHYDRKP
ncbi:MAG TPA: class I SAM-dependent methyltransferase [Thermoanaerobaculia bacterium]|nr:class I SAM-dependent methyltransferase [Thermoanaerobaculia bacterium]